MEKTAVCRLSLHWERYMRLAFGGRSLTMLILPIATLCASQAASAADPAPPAASAVEVSRFELASNQDTPELCFVLSGSVARRPATPLESFVGTEPAITVTATPRNDRLCLTGFTFGNDYTVTLKAGLPGVAGPLAKDTQFRVAIPNRPPELAFAAPESGLLPRIGSDGLPIRSVNVPKIDVQIFRVADDNLLFDSVRAPLTAETAAAFVPARGEKVWQGTIEPKGSQNQDTVTALATDQTIGTLKPGLYVATAWASGSPVAGRALPTQYFMVSDLGLAVYRGPDGLLVSARSLASTAAAPGIDIALIARNNRELARVRTDGNGLARFDNQPSQDNDGGSPASIRAYGPAGEFAALSLSDGKDAGDPRARSDVALIHADRALYRPGESVDILALLRSDRGVAQVKRPLTLTVLRPNGVVFASRTLSDQGDGSYDFAVAIPTTGSTGAWRIEARADDGDRPIGAGTFAVDGILQSHLNVALNADVAVIDPTQNTNISIQTQAPEGQIGNVPGDLRVDISAAAMPFPAFPGFSFGAVDEPIAPLPTDRVRFATDAAGKATLSIKIAVPPKATRPLEAVVTARVMDAGGRPVERQISVPVANQNLLLGVKPGADSLFPAGQSAHFEIIAVSPDGARQEKAGAAWEILRQDWKPSWSFDGHRFTYRPAVKDTHIAGGTIDIPANASAMLDTASLPVGRYRIEVFDPNGEAISSARFMVGWAVRNAGDPPDAVWVKPAKPTYAPGDGLDVFVKPPFEADVVLVPANPAIQDPTIQHVPAAGANVHLQLPRDSGIGMQLLATAVAPPDAAAPGVTRRAFGQVLVPADPAPRSLGVKLDLPASVMPQRTISIPVTVTGAGEDSAYVRVTLMDERTDSDEVETDSPLDPLIARQASQVGVIDNYGRIITPSGLSSGAVADLGMVNVEPQRASSQPKQPQMPLALYSGIMTLDKSGKGNVPLVLSDYAGKVRIKAVAWSGNRSGQAEAALAIRYPLNTSLPLPDFLAPDDRADLTLGLDNMDGPRGEYRIKLHAEGAITIQDEAESVVNLAEHEQRSMPVALQAHGPGNGTLTMSIKGPDGLAFERHLGLSVRSNAPTVTRHAVLTVKPGTVLTVDPALTGGIRPDSLTVSATAANGNDLDLGGIARELQATDAASAEQIVDAATLFLAPGTLSQSLGLDPTGAAPPTARLERAAAALAAYQGGDGGFSLFGASESDPWLTAYVVDFLGRAKTAGATVSDILVGQALNYLAARAEPSAESQTVDGAAPVYSQKALAIAAYANQVLAANGRLNLFQLRYFSDRFLSQVRTPVGAAFIASSFASLGEKPTAAAAFARAAALPIDPVPADISGSDLRDQALLNAVMAESGAAALPSVTAMAAKTAAIAAAHRQFSAQEAAWIFRAGIAQTSPEARVKAKVGDKTVDQNTALSIPGTGQALPAIKNLGDAPLHIAVTVTGAPAPGEVKDQAGYEVQRWLFDTSGKPIDPAAMRQGDLAVVVLTGRFTGPGDAHPVLRDPLPAGWEVEAAEIAGPEARYPWLRDMTDAGHVSVIGGQYVATPRLAGEHREFKVAYVVRAAVRGQFSLPGTLVEDRIQPALSARVAGSRIKIDPPS
jgi:uncharacterized protein YfaS (alpha-2-macroglobulin family)